MNKSFVRFILTFGLGVLAAASTLAAPFDEQIEFTQPDGTRIKLHGWGHDFYAVFETLDGYTVVFDQARKAYCYAQRAGNGELVSTGTEVHRGDPAALGLGKGLRMSAEARRQQGQARYQQWEAAMQIEPQWAARKAARRKLDEQAQAAPGGAAAEEGPQPAPPSSTTTGLKVGFTILIDFSDDPATVPQASIVDFCNGDGYTGYGNNGSVKEYYYDNSGGLLTYTNTVTFYIRAPQPKTYYNDTAVDSGICGRLLINECLNVMTNLPNYTTDILPLLEPLTVDGSSRVVACNVFFAGANSGVWSFGLWPHSWTLASAVPLPGSGKSIYKYQITNVGTSLRINTFCHENGHMLCGFPDIYDYGGDSVGGAGTFCLMNNYASTTNPEQICAYLKRAAGWLTPIELDSTSVLTASVTASVGSALGQTYRYARPGVRTEYFLIENRQKTGRDASIPAAGVAIWHVDELGSRDNQSLVPNTSHANYECSLIQADNLWHFQNDQNSGDSKDLFYSGNTAVGYKNQFTDYSSPGARWWDGKLSGARFRNFSVSSGTMTFTVGESASTEDGVTTLLDATTVNAAGAFTLGTNGSFNALIITNGGVLAVTNGGAITLTNGLFAMSQLGDGIIANTSASSNNTAMVTGAGSLWSNAAALYVGAFGSANSLTIRDGGRVLNTAGFVGYDIGADSNAVVVTDAGSVWSNSSSLFVGSNGAGNSLTISNTARVFSSDGWLGAAAGADGNTALVSDAGSLWRNSGALGVGNSSAFNSLTIASGGRVANGFGYVGNNTGASNNSVLVTGAGSLWSNGNNLIMGNRGSGNSLTIADGGRVTVVGGGNIGSASNSANNVALVTGAGSTWSNGGGAYVGVSGYGNNLTIAAGGQVLNTLGYVGFNGNASNNSALVTDAGSLWSNSSTLYIGNGGSGNSLAITNGGRVINTFGYVGLGSTANVNRVLVSDPGSVWSNSSSAYVGNSGSSNELVILNGGQFVSGGSVAVGSGPTAHANNLYASAAGYLASVGLSLGTAGSRSNTVTLLTNTVWNLRGGSLIWGTGAGAIGNSLVIDETSAITNIVGLTLGDNDTTFYMTNSADGLVLNEFTTSQLQFAPSGFGGLTVGSSGSRNTALIISNYFLKATASSYIGNSGTNAAVLVAGSSAAWSNSSSLYVGNSGSVNSLTITEGGRVLSSSGTIGRYGSADNNSALVAGPGSVWSNIGSLYVGDGGAGNSLTITNGGQVFNGSGYVGSGLTSVNNTVLVGGAGSLWRSAGSFFVGNAGSSNNLTIADGGRVAVTGGGNIGSANNSGGNTVLVTGNGSTWSNNSGVYVGVSGYGSKLLVANGGVVLNNSIGYVGFNGNASNNAALVTDAGSLWSNSSSLYVGNAGSGNSLVITNGGRVFNTSGYVGSGSTANVNRVLVSDPGSIWSNSNSAYVGNSGSSNELVILNGGQFISSGPLTVGSGPTAVANSLYASAAGYMTSSGLVIGISGSRSNTVSILTNTVLNLQKSRLTWGSGLGAFGNKLVIDETSAATNIVGLTLADNDTTFYMTNSADGLVLNSFTASQLQFVPTNFGSLVVGSNGSRNTTLIISNYLLKTTGTSYVGNQATNNSVIVSGAGAVWSNSAWLYVGGWGSSNTLTILQGGQVIADNSITIGNGPTAFANSLYASAAGYLASVGLSIGGAGSRSNTVTLVTNTVWNLRGGSLVWGEGSGSIGNSLVIDESSAITNIVGLKLGDIDTTFYMTNSADGLVLNGFTTNQLRFVSTNFGLLVVGSGSSNTRLIISNYTLNTTGNGYIGNGGRNAAVLVTGSGSVWRNSDLTYLYVGLSGESNSLTVAEGGQVFGSMAFVGYFASNNWASVNGNGSVWSNSSSLYVGFDTAGNRLRVTDGGRVLNMSSYVGNNAVASNNTVLVADAGSVWSNNGTLSVGYYGPNNSLAITNGGQVFSTLGTVGGLTGAVNNSVLVAGTGSVWFSASSVTIGGFGGANSMTIRAGGAVMTAGGFLGSSNNAVVVTDPGSVWSNNGYLYVGNSGARNSLRIDNGAQVINTTGYVGYASSSSNNWVAVTGNNSLWRNNGYLYVGDFGSSNSLTIAEGGRVINTFGYIGYTGTSNNTVLVTGPGSVWSNSSILYVGYSMSNSLTVADGGTVFSGSALVGVTVGASNNSVLVTGAASSWKLNNASLTLGNFGSGNRLTVSNGSQVLSGSGTLGYFAGATNNSAWVTDAGSLWSNSGNLYVGASGAFNNLTIDNNGQVFSSAGIIGSAVSANSNVALVTDAGSLWTNSGDLTIGSTGSFNQLTVTNAGSVVNNNGYIGFNGSGRNNSAWVAGPGSVWNNRASLTIGNSAGNSLTVAGGGQVFDANGYIGMLVGASNNSVLVTGPGSVWSNITTLNVGNAGSSNSLTLSDGGTVISSNILVGGVASSTGNLLTVSGGYLYAATPAQDGKLDIRRGTFALNSGTVVVDRLIATNGASSIVNINGGSLTAPLLLNAGQFTMNGGTLSVPVAFTNAAGGTFNLSGGSVLVPLEMNNLGAFNQTGGFFDPAVFTNSGAFTLSGGTNLAEIFLNLLTGIVTQSGGQHDVNYATNFSAWTISAGVANLTNYVGEDLSTLTVSGGTLNGSLTIGNTGSFSQLTITNGGIVAGVQSFLGKTATSSNNAALVTGAGSLWTNSVSLFIGYHSPGNRLDITAGGTVQDSNAVVGWDNIFPTSYATARHNAVTVNGAGSVWNNSGTLTIGANTDSNTLTIAGGGAVNSAGGYVGQGGIGNAATVSGTGSVWNSTGWLNVGVLGGSGSTLTLTNGGRVYGSGSFVGSAGNNNTAIVAGTGSVWGAAGDFTMGSGGAGNTLTVINGGVVSNNTAHVGSRFFGLLDTYFDGNNNNVVVAGVGSLWNNSGSLFLGESGTNNSLTIADGGTVLSLTGFVGFTATATSNSVLVTGPGSLWANSSDLRIGDTGSFNQLTVTNGGIVSSFSARLGNATASSNNSVLISGAGSLWGITEVLVVGQYGSGNSLTITNGGQVVDGSGYVGNYYSASNNAVLVSGAGSVWSNSGSLFVGYFGSANSLTITNGGRVMSVVGYVGEDASASNNAVLVSGAGSVLNNGDDYIGNSGSGNLLIVTNGGRVVDNSGYVGNYAGANNNAARVIGSGSVWTNYLSFRVGNAGSSNSLTIGNGGTVVAPNLIAGYDVSSTGNLLAVTDGFLYATNTSRTGILDIRRGTLTFDGGNIEADWLYATNNTATATNSVFNFNAGTLTTRGGSLIIAPKGNNFVIGATPGQTATWNVLGGTNVVRQMSGSTSNTILGGVAGAVGIVNVTGAGTVWSNSADVWVGGDSGGNSLIVTNGGRAMSQDSFIGMGLGASNNLVLVSDPGSVLSNSGPLYLGYYGSGNQLIVSNGAQVASLRGYIGHRPESFGNLALITGAGSLWTNVDTLSVGRDGVGNQLIVTNGGRVVAGNSFIGVISTGTNNLAVVSGPGSTWINLTNLHVGQRSSGNSLIVSDGGQVLDDFGLIGTQSGVSNNSALVTGSGSLWSNRLDLYVGYTGSFNQLTISDGARVVNQDGFIGMGLGTSKNSVLVSGSGTVWHNTSVLYPGYYGSDNQMVVSNGAVVTSLSGYIGRYIESVGNLALITGAGSVWTNQTFLSIGRDGADNRLLITNGGQVVNSYGYIGVGTSASNNAVVVAGAGSVWMNTNDVHVGQRSSGNNLTVADGGQVFDGIGFIGTQSGASNNSALVTGFGSLWSNTLALHVGSTGWNSRLTVADSGSVIAPTVLVGTLATSSNNLITISGGSLFATNIAGTGVLDIRRGALTLNSGTVTVNQLLATNFADSVVTFNGGTLNSGGCTVNNSTLFQVGNGVSAATLHLVGGNHSFADGLFINTNGWLTGTGAITGSITDSGTIAPGDSAGIITGSGDLTLLNDALLLMQLAGTNAWLYDQIVLAGTLNFGGTLTLSLLDGFNPVAGNRFDLFDFSSGSGFFSSTNLPTLDPLLYWDLSALYTAGEIEADAMTGSLQVTIAPAAASGAGAQWQVDAGAWQNSGDTVGGLLMGAHTVSYNDVTGWIKPADQLVAVGFNETTLTNGAYELTPVLLAAASRKVHLAAGTFDLNLNLNPALSGTIEPRRYGPTEVLFTFNKGMAATDGTLDASEFTLTNATFVSASIVSSNLTLNLTNVVDQARVTVALNGLADLAGNPLEGTNAVVIRVLYGDATQSGSVSVGDMQATKNKLSQALTSTNYLCDLNLSGTISVGDMQVAKNMLSHNVPAGDFNPTTPPLQFSTTPTFAMPASSLGEALGAPELAWDTNGDERWAPTIAPDGSTAAWSGSIGDLQVSWVETTVTGPGTLAFEWKVSSELDADFLTFSVDGVDQPGRISGEAGWQPLTFNIPSGTHRLRWTYAKNGENAVGFDAGWLRRVVYQAAP